MKPDAIINVIGIFRFLNGGVDGHRTLGNKMIVAQPDFVRAVLF